MKKSQKVVLEKMSCEKDCVKIGYSEWMEVPFNVYEHTKCGIGTVFSYMVSKEKVEEYSLYEIMKNRDLLWKLMKYAVDTYRWLPKQLKMDHEIALYALTYTIHVSESVPKELLSDKTFVMKLPGTYMEIVPKELRDDPEVVLHFVKECPYMIVYASKRILKLLDLDKKVIKGEHYGTEYGGLLREYELNYELDGTLEETIKSIKKFNKQLKHGDKKKSIAEIKNYITYLLMETLYIEYSDIGQDCIPKLQKLCK